VGVIAAGFFPSRPGRSVTHLEAMRSYATPFG
jgi:hypothetical protein